MKRQITKVLTRLAVASDRDDEATAKYRLMLRTQRSMDEWAAGKRYELDLANEAEQTDNCPKPMWVS